MRLPSVRVQHSAIFGPSSLPAICRIWKLLIALPSSLITDLVRSPPRSHYYDYLLAETAMAAIIIPSKWHNLFVSIGFNCEVATWAPLQACSSPLQTTATAMSAHHSSTPCCECYVSNVINSSTLEALGAWSEFEFMRLLCVESWVEDSLCIESFGVVSWWTLFNSCGCRERGFRWSRTNCNNVECLNDRLHCTRYNVAESVAIFVTAQSVSN